MDYDNTGNKFMINHFEIEIVILLDLMIFAEQVFKKD